MKVGFVARKGNLDISKVQIGLRGYSVQRLTTVLYEKLLEYQDDNTIIEKVEVGKGNSTFTRRATSFAELLYRNMTMYDIIHAPTPLPIKPLRIRNDTKIITTSHGIRSVDPDSPCYAFEHANRGIKNAIIDRFGAHQTIQSDFVIAVSSLTKKCVIDLGVEKDKVFVVNNGLDKRFIEMPKRKRSRKRFVVGYLGPLYPNKNVIFAINAFRKIKDSNMDFEIWGKKTYEYVNLAKAARGDKRIKFMGMSPEKELVATYDKFDAFVYPTLCDQFPGSVMEAQARGLPVVSYKYGEMSDESKKYCLKAEDENDMANILSKLKENGYSDKLKKKSTKYARSFTSDKQAKETFNVYKKVNER